MMLNRKKKEIERLKESFGKFKDGYFDFKLIETYFRNNDNASAFQILSDKTCADLDFEDLFLFLDRTNSNIGQQYLYNKLRAISINAESTELDERIISELVSDSDLRVSIQRQLIKLQKYDAYYVCSLFQEEHLRPPKYFFILKLLSLFSLGLLILLPFNPQLLFILLGVFVINLGIHLWNKKNLFKYLGLIPQLLQLNTIAFNLHKKEILKNIAPQLSTSIKVINQVRNRMLFFQLEGKLQGDLAVIFWGTFELVKALFLLEPLLLFGVLKRLNTKRREIENVFEFIGRIDSLISIASLRNGSNSFCIPNIKNTSKDIRAIQVYHPLIVNCTPNDLDFSKKSVLLTGSNMSGKTSFIRTIGINTITALTINTCFAASYSCPPVKVFTALRISDDLLNDKSYYLEEVLTIKKMLDESRNENSNLFLLDEIFKGTNTVERVSAGKAVLSALTKNGNMVLVSTHDIELTDMLLEEYNLYHFSEIVVDKKVDFDYELKAGKLKNRNAIRILQVNNYPDGVINEAIEISKELDKNRLNF